MSKKWMVGITAILVVLIVVLLAWQVASEKPASETLMTSQEISHTTSAVDSTRTAGTTTQTESAEVYQLWEAPVFLTEEGYVDAIEGDLAGMVNAESIGSEQALKLLEDTGLRQTGFYYRLAYLPPLVELELVTAHEYHMIFVYSIDYDLAEGTSVHDVPPDHKIVITWFRSEQAKVRIQGEITDGTLSGLYKEEFHIKQRMISVDDEIHYQYEIYWTQNEEWFSAIIPRTVGMEKAFDLCSMKRITTPVHKQVAIPTEPNIPEDITLSCENDSAVYSADSDAIRLQVTNDSDRPYKVLDTHYVQRFDEESKAWHLLMQISNASAISQINIAPGETGVMIVHLDELALEPEPGRYRIYVFGLVQSVEFDLVK